MAAARGWHEPSRRPSTRSRRRSPAGISRTGPVSPRPGVEVYVRHERVIFAFPTNDGLFAIFVAWPIGERHAVQADLERQFMAVIDLVPDLAERVRTGRRTEVLRGRQPAELSAQALPVGMDLGRRCRVPQEPLPGVGHLRCLSRRRTAGRCHRPRAGRPAPARRSDGGLRAAPQRSHAGGVSNESRSRAVHAVARGPATAQAALRGNQEATNRFFMAREGMIPPETFFNPDNLQRIMAKAAGSG